MTARRRDQPLTRDELLDAALRIVDSQGLAALTMRRLADALGVEAMSLYHHVPNKDALLEWTVERMQSEMRLPDPLPEDWVDLMAAIFGEYGRVLAAHPNLLPFAGRTTGGVEPTGLAFLIATGFEPDDAVELLQSLAAFTVGFSILRAPSAQVDAPQTTRDLAERSREWRDETCHRGLRMIMEAYRPRRHPDRGGRATDAGRRS